jgi:uncharacterized integral membrane protein
MELAFIKLNVSSFFDMIYLLLAIGLTPCGSSTVHIYTQTLHRTTQLTTRTTHLTTEQHVKIGVILRQLLLLQYVTAFYFEVIGYFF